MIEDSQGQRGLCCGTRVHRADVFDYDGRVSISFEGWNFLSMPITDKSSIPDLSTPSSLRGLGMVWWLKHEEPIVRAAIPCTS